MAELSPLRRRMIEDMPVRNLSPATQRSHVHAVAKFGRYFNRSPDRLGLKDVRAFQVHLVSTGISWPALNQTVCALRFSTASRSATAASRSASPTRGSHARFRRSEEHTSELQSLMRISYDVFCLQQNKTLHTDKKNIVDTHYEH